MAHNPEIRLLRVHLRNPRAYFTPIGPAHKTCAFRGRKMAVDSSVLKRLAVQNTLVISRTQRRSSPGLNTEPDQAPLREKIEATLRVLFTIIAQQNAPIALLARDMYRPLPKGVEIHQSRLGVCFVQVNPIVPMHQQQL